MKILNLKRIAVLSVFAFALLFGLSTDANAQGKHKGWYKNGKLYEKEQKRYAKEQRKAAERNYRLYRGSRYYQVDQRGYDLIRSAVNSGYQQGYQAGADDRRFGRRSYYQGSPYYRSGTYGYQSYVAQNQYQYYFRQGFLRGYQDGYNDQSRYGYRSGGTLNIIGTILNGILNARSF
jgi:hypothetical protein